MQPVDGSTDPASELTEQRNRRAQDLLQSARDGDADAVNEIITMIYPELRRRAQWLMAGERQGHTFGPSGSELVQRVMEKMLLSGGDVFEAASAEEDLINLLSRHMRFVLVDYARARLASRRSGQRRVDFDDVKPFTPAPSVNLDEVLSVDDVLNKLEHHDVQAAQALQLRFFAGFTNEEAARAMNLTVATFRRSLRLATVFLKSAMELEGGS
jgi:RNA polymerase sigma factor (TIGR02999 family)